MNKVFAVVCSLILHIVFVTGFAATGAVATQIATDRAFHVLLS